jgi:FMN-dependent NADH-azoreductase
VSDHVLANGTTLLRIDASARFEGAYSRALADTLVESLKTAVPSLSMTVRDLALLPPSFVNAGWIAANTTADADRTDQMRSALAESDQLIAEVQAADTLLICCPIYNFAVPAALKAWIDQICRARMTFAYTESGPKGLLENKRAVIILTSGGTAADGPIDFASAYLRHILGFIGITDVQFILADRLMIEGEDKIALARTAIDILTSSLFHHHTVPA